MIKEKHIFIIGTLIRVVLLIYGEWQDRNFEVKYTDVDYNVYSDASRYVSEGKSPYLRHTYRYTPILSYILLPNIYFSFFGKLIFIASDLICGSLLSSLLSLNNKSYLFTTIWLLNPLVFNISTRGSSDSIASLLILLTIYYLQTSQISKAGIIYGLAVHFRIYPIIYALLFYLNIDSAQSKFFTYNRIKFTILSAGLFLSLAAIFYWIYGYEFLFETYLYHFARKDNRHNFSVYFYPLYLTYNDFAKWVGLMAFLPQWGLILLVSCIKMHFYVALLAVTFVFVIFNKVCTAQYFIWYITLVPIAIPYLKSNFKDAVSLVLPWILTEVHWLYWGYRLEFLGENVFFQLWLASLLFFISNIRILTHIISNSELPHVKSS